ncbi:MAG: chemotaxis protein CheW [Cyanobacteria bacterium P01_A01_bin.114]
MAIISPSRLRLAKTYRLRQQQQLIVFKIGRDHFALPIQSVARVVSMGDTCAACNHVDADSSVQQGQEMAVLDVGHHVFGGPSSRGQHCLLSPSKDNGKLSGYLIVAKTRHHALVGLPVKSQPSIRWVERSAFSPLPLDYMAKVNINCVSSLVIEPEQPPLFLLNPDQLGQLRPCLQKTQTSVQSSI